MNAKAALVGGVVVVGCTIAGLVSVKREEPPRTARPTTIVNRELRAERTGNQTDSTEVPPADPAAPQPLTYEEFSNHTERAPAPKPVNTESETEARTRQVLSQGQPATPPKEKIQDPLARVALSLVGFDSDAEAYWIEAINDPRLSAHERQDLIEDLNEDGFSDPRHPGPQDLPIIVNRLRLIEELAPYAKDQVNWDAFMEAYKDLVNMLYGRPVQ